MTKERTAVRRKKKKKKKGQQPTAIKGAIEQPKRRRHTLYQQRPSGLTKGGVNYERGVVHNKRGLGHDRTCSTRTPSKVKNKKKEAWPRAKYQI